MFSHFNKYANENGIEKAAEFARSIGYSSVELYISASSAEPMPFAYDAASARHAKKVLNDAGLSVSCFSAGANVKTFPDVKEKLLHLLEIAAELGSPYLHHTVLTKLFDADGVKDYQESIDKALEVAIPVANRAAELGMKCIYEDQGIYVNGVEGYGGFYQEMKRSCKNVGVCADFGNSLFVGVPAEDFIKAYLDDIVHVHIKDYYRVQSQNSPGTGWYPTPDNWWLKDAPIGCGVVNFNACMELLKQANYQGTYAFEINPPDSYEAAAKQAMQYLEQFQ